MMSFSPTTLSATDQNDDEDELYLNGGVYESAMHADDATNQYSYTVVPDPGVFQREFCDRGFVGPQKHFGTPFSRLTPMTSPKMFQADEIAAYSSRSESSRASSSDHGETVQEDEDDSSGYRTDETGNEGGSRSRSRHSSNGHGHGGTYDGHGDSYNYFSPSSGNGDEEMADTCKSDSPTKDYYPENQNDQNRKQHYNHDAGITYGSALIGDEDHNNNDQPTIQKRTAGERMRSNFQNALTVARTKFDDIHRRKFSIPFHMNNNVDDDNQSISTESIVRRTRSMAILNDGDFRDGPQIHDLFSDYAFLNSSSMRLQTEYYGEGFDFAIMLSTDEDYEYWSNVLDFSGEICDPTEFCEELKWIQSFQTGNNSTHQDNVQGAGQKQQQQQQEEEENKIQQILQNLHKRSECSFRPSLFDRAVEEQEDYEYENCDSNEKESCCNNSLEQHHNITANGNGFDTPNNHNRRNSLTSQYAQTSTRRRMTDALLRRGSNSTLLLSPSASTTMTRSHSKQRTFSHQPSNSNALHDGNIDPSSTLSSPIMHKKLNNSASRQAVPRGIAARAKLGEFEIFLQAMSHGFVVKRHRPKSPPTFVKLFSEDGGDTIQYVMINQEEAIVAINEQRLRYNQNLRFDIDNFRCKDGCSDNDNCDPFIPRCNRRHPLPSDLPDHLAAERFREEANQEKGSFMQSIKATMQIGWDKFESSGSIKAADIIDVHPSKKVDPFFTRHPSLTIQGTMSLRESPSTYCPCNTFSIVTPSILLTRGKSGPAASDEYLCQRWYNGRGNPKNFNYINFETGTEGEFWVILRGFLRLHRDAASNRFAAQRARGIGGNFARINRQQQLDEEIAKEREKNRQTSAANSSAAWNVVVNTPVAAAEAVKEMTSKINSSLRKRRKSMAATSEDLEAPHKSPHSLSPGHSCRTSVDDEVDYGSNDEESKPTLQDQMQLARQLIAANTESLKVQARAAIERAKSKNNDCALDPAAIHSPPPSDYFLGFKSAGTQIWARLRQAGLETQRIYGLDRSKVILVVRCPEDRLQDVAEVIRLRLRTKDGLNLPKYLPFRETHAGIFQPSNEISDNPLSHSLFRSNDRQYIINFILHSQVNDTGAQLGQRSKLGRHIQAHVPLHNYERLNILYKTWVLFWHYENWIGRDGRSMSSDRSVDYEVDSKAPPPNTFYRFFRGVFYQPLDSIEQYYGSNVAFYFAWLQHCAVYLVPLSIIGFFVFIAQLNANSWDHWSRIPFSFIVMLWSFLTMVSWNKRAKVLAHRWGTLNYEEEETTRPQFKGSYKRVPNPANPAESIFVRDPITNELVFNNPWWKRALTFSIGILVTLGVTLGLLVMILIFNANRDILIARYFDEENEDGNTFTWDFSAKVIGRTTTAQAVDVTAEYVSDPYFWFIMIVFPLLLGISLPVLNFIFMKVAVFLNDFENYKTESEYRNFLVLKVFAFRFVCYFATLYYYAFVSSSGFAERNDHGYLASENGILRVATSLIIFVSVAHWWLIFATVYLPILIHRLKNSVREKSFHALRYSLAEIELRLKNWHYLKEFPHLYPDEKKALEESPEDMLKKLKNGHILLSQAMHPVWNETSLPQYNSLADYIYAVTMFAYVTCFSVVLPITPVFILLNTLLSMRVDAFKLCQTRRSGIGVWEHVLHIVTVIAVLTNCALMAVTSNFFGWINDNVGSVGVVFICIAWEHVMLLIKYIINSASSGLPKSIIDAMKEEKIKAAKRRNVNVGARHRQSKMNLVDEQGEQSPQGSNEPESSIMGSALPSEDPNEALSTIMSGDDTDRTGRQSFEQITEMSSNMNKENLNPVPKPVPQEDNANSDLDQRFLHVCDSHDGTSGESEVKTVVGVKDFVDKIEEKQSVEDASLNDQFKIEEKKCIKNIRMNAVISPKSLTPVDLLHFKKTRLTPPPTSLCLKDLNIHQFLNTPSSAQGSIASPRKLSTELALEKCDPAPSAPPVSRMSLDFSASSESASVSVHESSNYHADGDLSEEGDYVTRRKAIVQQREFSNNRNRYSSGNRNLRLPPN